MGRILYLLLFWVANIFTSNAQITGLWYNVDDEDGKPKSQIMIAEKNAKLEAKVVKLLPGATVTHCNACKGDNKGKSIEGMRIMYGLSKTSNTLYEGGEIIDPKSGKIYSVFVELVEKDKLKVRGYIGLSLMGRTQYWYRVKQK